MKWRELVPFLRDKALSALLALRALWHRPAGPMNWKNPIRVLAVVGWSGFQAAGKIVLESLP